MCAWIGDKSIHVGEMGQRVAELTHKDVSFYSMQQKRTQQSCMRAVVVVGTWALSFETPFMAIKT